MLVKIQIDNAAIGIENRQIRIIVNFNSDESKNKKINGNRNSISQMLWKSVYS